jgi:hypothetical protein
MSARLAAAVLLSSSALTLAQAAEPQTDERAGAVHSAPAPAHSYAPAAASHGSSSHGFWSSGYSPPSPTWSGSRPADLPAPYYAAPFGNGLPPAHEPPSVSEPFQATTPAHFSLPPRLSLPPPHATAQQSAPSPHVAGPVPVPPPPFFAQRATPQASGQAASPQVRRPRDDGAQISQSQAQQRRPQLAHNDQEADPPWQFRERLPGSQMGALRPQGDGGFSVVSGHLIHHGHPADWRADRIAAHLAWQRHHHAAFVAWAGPLFWPYAYTDLLYYPFWPDAYDDAYWSDVYDDFADSIYWTAGDPDSDDDDESTAAPDDLGLSHGRWHANGAGADRCGTDAAITTWPFDRIESVLRLTAEQQVLLDALKAVAAQTASYLKASCPHTAALTPTARLAAMLKRLQATLNAAHAVHAPLMTFYGSLSDEQKARLDTVGPDAGPKARVAGSADPACSAHKPGFAELHVARIADVVDPSGQQQSKLDELAKANRQAVAVLHAVCGGIVPRTPVGRLEAIETRLAAMIQAAKAIEPALQNFYGSLTREQRSRFNRLAEADER